MRHYLVWTLRWNAIAASFWVFRGFCGCETRWAKVCAFAHPSRVDKEPSVICKLVPFPNRDRKGCKSSRRFSSHRYSEHLSSKHLSLVIYGQLHVPYHYKYTISLRIRNNGYLEPSPPTVNAAVSLFFSSIVRLIAIALVPRLSKVRNKGMLSSMPVSSILRGFCGGIYN